MPIYELAISEELKLFLLTALSPTKIKKAHENVDPAIFCQYDVYYLIMIIIQITRNIENDSIGKCVVARQDRRI